MTPELTAILEEAFALTAKGETVLLMFDDMVEVNDHFQATLDYFKENGNKMKRRFGQGAFMESGVVYFVGADTHLKESPDGQPEPIRTRGVAREFDLRPYASELVRKSGLEARLRAKAAKAPCASFPEQACLGGCEDGCKRSAQAASAA